MVSKIHGTRVERLLKQCYDAIRYHNVTVQYEETKQRLETEIPVREELERKRDTLIKVNRTKDKYNLFRQMCIRYADVKYRALMIWKENVQYHNHIMKRIKLRIIELHKCKLSKAFNKWRESADRKHMVDLITFTDEITNEN